MPVVRVLIDETAGDDYRLQVLLDETRLDDDARPDPHFIRSWTWHGVPREECLTQAKGLIEWELSQIAPPPTPTAGSLAGKEFKL